MPDNRQHVKSPNLVCPEPQGCIKLRLAPPRGADFQSAVSQVSNLRTAEKASGMGIPPVCRLEVGDTAGWKPALRSAESSELDAALPEPTRSRCADKTGFIREVCSWDANCQGIAAKAPALYGLRRQVPLWRHPDRAHEPKATLSTTSCPSKAKAPSPLSLCRRTPYRNNSHHGWVSSQSRVGFGEHFGGISHSISGSGALDLERLAGSVPIEHGAGNGRQFAQHVFAGVAEQGDEAAATD